jgi:ferredoxin-NADP reductase
VRLDLGGAPFVFAAGQAALIGPETHEARIPYSIASAPIETSENGWLDFLIKVEPSGRWGHLFDAVAPGMRLGIQGPFGAFLFPSRPPERHFLFIAGGTGIAPIRSMLRHIVLARQPGEARVLYSARTPGEFPYIRELRAMDRDGTLDLTLTATGDVGARWRGGRGRIASARLATLVGRPDTMCFVCGPATMMADVPLMLMGLGIAKHRIRVEEW